MSSLHNFQPNGKLYKTFCFHVKNVSMAVGMIEILFICVLLIGVPEISLHLCNCPYKNITLKNTNISNLSYGINYTTTEMSIIQKRDINNTKNITLTTSLITTSTTKYIGDIITTTQLYNHFNNNSNNNDSRDCYKLENIIEKRIIIFSLCNMDILWLFIALSHIIFVNLFIYGIKSTKPKTIIPYLISKTIFICILIIFITLSTIILVKDHSKSNKLNSTIYVNKLIFGALIIGFFIMLYTLIINFFTYHFVKRSFETGYSISAARPFAQPSGSISDHLRQSRDNPTLDNNRDQVNRIELTSRNQEQSSNDNISTKRNYVSTYNQIPKVLPPLRHTFRPNTANRLPEK
ncbi:Hypothetical protein SRAE_1000005500 [Strongyloides ratti]|uniref:Uncharacterized protein n=1 Tax=Strongyloides ratti TaxID=34506 RepID=A0A090L2U5_STRRB|nr:Hypothetical protein SRAE_1000005500 [Strongyloides ratti]CEF61779.1 Hypothetical protein SRAE_1000005500 [Strongyloides ratti]